MSTTFAKSSHACRLTFISDRTILPTIEAIQSTLPSQLERVTALAEAADWEAVRLRLANEKKPLETEVSALVRAVEQQVSTELAAQLMETTRSQQRILIIVPSTALLALAVAAFLGLVVMRSITRPLGRLIAGSKALAKVISAIEFQWKVMMNSRCSARSSTT
jgi:nitrogen fixation/metabolism regulation signal transduction histidine kinase